MGIYENIARSLPGLKHKLKQAGMIEEPEMYVKKTLFTAGFMSVGLMLVFFLFYPHIYVVITLPFLYILFFFYFIKYVDVRIERLKRDIDQEIVFAGRFLIIELDSGVPIFKAFENVEKNYAVVGKYFGDIMNKVYLGTNIEDAINETLLNTPSSNMRKLLWQILNSIKTGAEAGAALNTIIDQIVREQQITVAEYGKKLNPIAMFYMMTSIIFPTIGTTMLIVLLTFVGVNVTMPFFAVGAFMLAFVQFMFLSIIRTTRPPISG